METETAKNIEAARREMVKGIRSAMACFTERTGVSVSSIFFEAARALDEDGQNHATCYYDIRFNLTV